MFDPEFNAGLERLRSRRTEWPSQGVLEAVLALVAARPHELAAIFEASPESLVAFDPHRRILHANARAEHFFGYGRGALEGVLTDVLLPERLRQPQAPPMVPVADVMQVDLPGQRRDGTEFAVEWTFGSVPAPLGALFVMTVRDRAAIDHAIETLRASEERFRMLVEGVHDFAIFMLDPTGHVSSWNKGAERSKGFGASEILGKSYEIFFTSEDRAAGLPHKLLEATVRQGSQDASGWRVRKDGTRFRASAYLTALRSSSGELLGFAKMTRDLTEKLEAEELERKLSAERMAREAAEAAEQRVRSSEARLRRLQRVTAALSEAATPTDVAAVVLDQCLQALDANGGAVYALSADGGALELIDQRGHPAEPMVAYERISLGLRSPLTDAARERTPGFFESFDACADLYPHLREAIRSGGFEASVALPLITHGVMLGALGIRFLTPRVFDSSDRSLLLTLSELCAQALERARLLAAERDARAEAEAANRSKDEFLAMLGHELRNPLAPIVTALSLMELRDVGRTLHNERTVIERQVAHLVRLVDDLLDVSRITQEKVELKKERIQLASVVARAVELSSPLLEQRRHRLSVSVPDDGLAVYGDATRLSQVVSNLLTNAAKYTPPAGHIEITAWRKDARIVLTVRDDGIGIAPAMLPRVFELFAQERQSLERSQGGLGLGLAIVKSLITMHEGTVSAFSDGHGKGSVFTIEIPAAGPEGGRSAEARPLTVRVAPGKSLRVLVVDDNADAADLLAEALGASGHVTSVAQDGPTALHVACTFRPDIALLDIGLPVMDGYELAGRLRSQFGAVRLIAVTGYGQTPDRERARAAGFDVHLIKPVDLDALLAAVG
jgi:PAS domain S-box-containing protein